MLTAASYVAFGVVGWILGYVAKHWLDRKFLPKILDWWAKLSKERALLRAAKLARQHKDEKIFLYQERISQQIITSTQMAAINHICIIGINFVTMTLILRPDRIDRIDPLLISIAVLILISISSIFSIYGIISNTNLSVKMDFEFYERYISFRIVTLLKSAGMDSGEIADWIRNYPDIYKVFCEERARTEQTPQARDLLNNDTDTPQSPPAGPAPPPPPRDKPADAPP